MRSISFLLLIALASPSSWATAMEMDELMRHIDQLWRGDTSHAEMSMTVKTRHYQRTMTMESWSKGKSYSLVWIQQPIKDRGVSTLKVEENIWNYLPKINRVTKVPSSMMSGSWMGSHFTNDDLVKESSYQDDYVSHISFEGVRAFDEQQENVAIYEITSIPKTNAAVVWGKVVMDVTQADLMPVQTRYFDEDGQLMRTMAFDQPERIQGRLIPMRLTLIPEDKPEESTEILYHRIEFDVPLDNGFFSLQNLKRRR